MGTSTSRRTLGLSSSTIRWASRIGALIWIAAISPAVLGQDDPRRLAVSIFRLRCIACHGSAKQESDLRLDNRTDALRGGESGAVIEPGASGDSELIRRVSSTDPDDRMPPEGDALPPDQIEFLRRWIDDGAQWPEDIALTPVWGDLRLDHWAWKPIEAIEPPNPPSPKTSRQNEIDCFVLAKLDENGLALSPLADRAILIRRVTFDLIGLPPTPDEIEQFIADPDPNAYEKLIERLLQSPRYGERWARHWLDVVHYADTHGYDKDQPRPNAWPYRDYVIRSFNDDKPYSRFVSEQIAGDVLFPDSLDGAEAMGFVAAGPWDLIGHAEVAETKTDGKTARHLDRDDMVANTIGTFCSVTIHCAQCHDHKFDPITQQDYYSLQSVFAALDRADRRYYSDREKGVCSEELLKSKADAAAQLTKIQSQLSEKPAAEKERQLNEELQSVQTQLNTIESELVKLPQPITIYCANVYQGSGSFCGTGPSGQPRPIHVLDRGNVLKPGALAEPGGLSMLAMLPSRFVLAPDHREGDRRAALAAWIVDPENPLTWRSIVNRIWQQHFGQGIVDTANDFGRMGGLPSHPELLDWLAADFRDHGGSLKRLHKQITLSAVYRQCSSSEMDERTIRASAVDADNRLLWRQNRRKLDAESIHDAVLSASGKLDLAMGGPGYQDFVIEHPEHSPHYEYAKADPRDPRCFRRAVYRFIVRSQTQPFLSCLDCADPSLRVAKRNESISPLQALTLLNNPFMIAQSEYFADRLTAEAEKNAAEQIDLAAQWTWGRRATPDERRDLSEFTEQFGWPALCRALFNSSEFMFVD